MINNETYVDGANSIYEPILESLRNFLGSINYIKNSKGGAIIFFTKRLKEENTLMVKVFPFKIESTFLEKAKASLSEHEIKDILEQLNEEKFYHQFSHYETFSQANLSELHFTTKVAQNNVLHYDDTHVQYNGTKVTWKEFYRSVRNGEIEKNTYEQLFFESGCNEISYIPLPVLSTPFILLVLNNSEEIKLKRHELLRLLYFRSRDTVSKYLYSRIIDNLTVFLQRDADNITEREVVERFVLELCDILLPISYRINDGEEKVYYNQWPSGTNGSEYILTLLDKNTQSESTYKVVFKLTSFVYTNLEDKKSRSWPLFHTSNLYRANIQQSSLLISKLFNLLFNYWRSLKIAKETADKKIREVLSGVNINVLVEMAQRVQQELNDIEVRIKKAESEPINLLQIDKDDQVTLIINGTELIKPRELEGKGQIAGFKYLLYMLKQAKNHDYNYSVNVMELYEEGGSTRKPHAAPARKSKDKKADFKMRSNELIEDISYFVREHTKVIDHCLEKRIKSLGREFNNGFFYYAKLHLKLKDCKAYKMNNVSNRKMDALIALYKKIDKRSGSKETQLSIDKADIKDDLKGLNIARNTYKPGDEIRFVRDCFKAIIDKIRKIGLIPEKADAVNLLLRNLCAAGLIQENKSLPKDGNKYTYNQKNNQPYIKWEFESKNI